MPRKVNDHFFPDGPPLPVGQVVNLVHDDEREPAEAIEPGGFRVQHVSQDLGGHDDHRCIRVAGCVAGQQTDRVTAVAGHQVGVLLVRQRLDRRGVEAALTAGKGKMGRELADDRLAGAGRCGDQDAVACLEGRAGLDLEGIEAERVTAHKVGESRGESLGVWLARGHGEHFVSLRDARSGTGRSGDVEVGRVGRGAAGTRGAHPAPHRISGYRRRGCR